MALSHVSLCSRFYFVIYPHAQLLQLRTAETDICFPQFQILLHYLATHNYCSCAQPRQISGPYNAEVCCSISLITAFLSSTTGGSRDFGAAAAWFRLAATEGHAEAMWLLGR